MRKIRDTLKKEKTEMQLAYLTEHTNEDLQQQNPSANKAKFIRYQPVKEALQELVAFLKETSKGLNKNDRYQKKLALTGSNRFQCYFCKKPGHSFRQCRRASDEDKTWITENLPRRNSQDDFARKKPSNSDDQTEILLNRFKI